MTEFVVKNSQEIFACNLAHTQIIELSQVVVVFVFYGVQFCIASQFHAQVSTSHYGPQIKRKKENNDLKAKSIVSACVAYLKYICYVMWVLIRVDRLYKQHIC